MTTKTMKSGDRRAVALSLGSHPRRVIDRSAYEQRLEMDDVSIDLASMLRMAGLWDGLPRAQKSRIRQMPPLHVTTVTSTEIGRGRQPGR